MLGHQQMTKISARVLLAVSCAGLICGLGVLVYVFLLIAKFRGALRQTVIAMNEPERLALFERAAQEELLTSALTLAITWTVAAIPFAMVLRQIRAALRTNQN